NPVPTGFAAYNVYLAEPATYFWDKRAATMYPGDISKAVQYSWYRNSASAKQAIDLIGTIKKPLESRVWYSYQGQTGYYFDASAQVAAIGRVLDDGSSQIYKYEYNALGKVTKETDPLGRETDYFYGTNNVVDANQTTGMGLDLLQVKQKNGTGY